MLQHMNDFVQQEGVVEGFVEIQTVAIQDAVVQGVEVGDDALAARPAVRADLALQIARGERDERRQLVCRYRRQTGDPDGGSQKVGDQGGVHAWWVGGPGGYRVDCQPAGTFLSLVRS